jgi:hypothetical protein
MLGAEIAQWSLRARDHVCFGTKLTNQDVRCSVAIEDGSDMTPAA